MSCSYPNCPCGYKSPLCDEYPPKPSQPQPAASSAVEQAIQNLKLAIENCRLEPACEADWQIKALIAAVRAESCPACAEKDQQLAKLSRYKRAVDNHLCEHDKEDWLRCSYNHNKECAVCQHDVREHQWLERAERAEAEITRLQDLVGNLESTLTRVRAERNAAIDGGTDEPGAPA